MRRLLLVAVVALAMTAAPAAAGGGGGPGPDDPFFALEEDTVLPGGTYQLTQVRCGTAGPTATLTMTGPFPGGDFVASGTVDLVAGTGSLTVPDSTAFGEYRLDLACSGGRGFAAAVFVGEPDPEPEPEPEPGPEPEQTDAPTATPVDAGPRFTG